jgi:hypothetical protein
MPGRLTELPAEHTAKYKYERAKRVLTRNTLQGRPEGKLTFEPLGGKTTCTILSPAGVAVAEGTATCRPDEAFVKALGRTIALGRALAQLDGTLARREQKRLKKLNRELH